MSKSKNLARTLQVNTSELSKAVREQPPENRKEAWDLVKALRDQITGDNLGETEHREQLSSCRGWNALRVVTLENRHLPLQDNRIPTTEAELYELCLFLLSRDDDDDMRRNFLKGMAGEQNPYDFLRGFCTRLWKISKTDASFYRCTVSGRHEDALLVLGKTRQSETFPQTEGASLLGYMALIWAAHDVQTSTARAMKASTKPLGWLLMGAGKRMTAGTIFSIFRPIFHLLSRMFGDYRTVEEAGRGKPESNLPRHGIVKDVRERVFSWLSRSQLREHKRSGRDEFVVHVRDDLANKSDDFWEEVRLPGDSGKYTHKRMTQVWYAGLTPVEVVGLPVVRFIQAEQVVQQQIGSLLRHSGLPRAYVLPVFDATKLRRGWKTRARTLIADQRRVILKDGDKDSVQLSRGESIEDAAAGLTKNDALIDSVAEFLEKAGRLKLHGSNPNLPEVQAITRLDVAVNQRFGFR